jgi:hypothetical protein
VLERVRVGWEIEIWWGSFKKRSRKNKKGIAGELEEFF